MEILLHLSRMTLKARLLHIFSSLSDLFFVSGCVGCVSFGVAEYGSIYDNCQCEGCNGNYTILAILRHSHSIFAYAVPLHDAALV